MKKFIALLLAVLMALSLIACSNGATNTGTSNPSNPASTPAGSADTADKVNVSYNLNALGGFDSGVDPASRDTYKIAYMYMRPMALFQNVSVALQELSVNNNYEIVEYCANSDIDALIQNIQMFNSQGVDGYLVVADPTAAVRTTEVLKSTGKPYIALLNSLRDDNGSCLIPCIGIDGVVAGGETVAWLIDNHETYWGDIGDAKVGLLNFNFSANSDFNDRNIGSKAKFVEMLPNGTVFEADGISGALNEQTGYDLAAAIFAANPDIEYWYVAGCIELYSQGAARAAEALNMEDRVLITAVGSDVLPAEWDNGYDGCWVSCLALSNYQYAVPCVSALIAMLDGVITAEELWDTSRAEGDQYTFFNVSYGLLTKDNYVEFFEQVKKDAGLA